MSNDERPIAAIATALAPAALAAIRLSGDRAVDLLAARFSRPQALRRASGHTMHHGSILDAEGRAVDEVLVAVYRRPRSYTGEESAEVFCHGSPAGVRRVLAVLLASGFAAARPGEFTRRAFLNGRLDLTRAEAVNEIVNAHTARAHALALDRLEGSVEAAVREVRAELIATMAQLAIQLDYPEEETGPVEVDAGRLRRAGERARSIASTYGRGRLFQEGVRVAIAGRTNAGKSALFNRLLRHDRSIVSDVHGTTRDYVEALIDVEGVPVRLFDTAGLRTAGEAIEEEGIRRSRTIIAASDLVIYVVDSAQGLTEEDASRLAEIRRTTPALVVLNKADLVSAGLGSDAGRNDTDGVAGRDGPAARGDAAVGEAAVGEAAVAVSAFTGDGLETLNARLLDALLEGAGAQETVAGAATADATSTVAAAGSATARGGPGARRSGVREPVIDSERQHALLLRAAGAIERTLESLEAGVSADAVAVDLQDALDAVGEITGEVASAEILDAMFGSFCVGK
ncbi:MAG: tRNA uridine-5-carboxymethylaminomethyl(34) synthesis GTPase MnmE [bacterium]